MYNWLIFYTSAGVQAGACLDVSSAHISEGTNRLGIATAVIPRASEGADFATVGRQIGIWREAEGEIFRGYITDRKLFVGENGVRNYTLEMFDLGIELQRLNTWRGHRFANVTMQAACDEILLGTGWSITCTGVFPGITKVFDNQTKLECINELSGIGNAYWRKIGLPSAKTLAMVQTPTATGMTISNVEKASIEQSVNKPSTGVIRELMGYTQEMSSLANRIVPEAKADGDELLTLQSSARVTPYTIQSVLRAKPSIADIVIGQGDSDSDEEILPLPVEAVGDNRWGLYTIVRGRLSTRWYLPSIEAADVSPAINGTWDITAGFVRRKAVLVKVGDPLFWHTYADANIAQREIMLRQYVTEPLMAQVIPAQSMRLAVKCQEDNAVDNMFVMYHVYAVSNNGLVVRGNMLNMFQDGTEMPLGGTFAENQTRIVAAVTTAVTIQDGDRLVFEIGGSGDPTSTGHEFGIIFGDAPAADLPLGGDDEFDVNLAPWVDFQNGSVELQSPGGGIPISIIRLAAIGGRPVEDTGTGSLQGSSAMGKLLVENPPKGELGLSLELRETVRPVTLKGCAITVRDTDTVTPATAAMGNQSGVSAGTGSITMPTSIGDVLVSVLIRGTNAPATPGAGQVSAFDNVTASSRMFVSTKEAVGATTSVSWTLTTPGDEWFHAVYRLHRQMNYYIEDATSVAAYGAQELVLPLGTFIKLSKASIVDIANAMYDYTVDYLKGHKDPANFYDFAVTYLPLGPLDFVLGNSIRTIYQDADEQLDTALICVERNQTFDESGVREWELVMSDKVQFRQDEQGVWLLEQLKSRVAAIQINQA